MKSTIAYTLKVCLTTLIASVPVTMVIGGAYIGLIMLIKPSNYSFNFNITYTHTCIFVAITAAAILVSSYFLSKVGLKRFINDRPIAHSIVIFLFYLFFSGALHFMDFGHLLFSYGPMFLTAYASSRLFFDPKGSNY
ncbi:hypothetical protein DU508_13620 [Pedobacter chinensis]|uniref:Uncharacterized protein n=1 Tax=Pedobacter chinensis TaxID=2282421 RepID=A0A369PTP8_9SPHI|nr:hypothetical protein [Pedobacter chinensis]RDC55904.1 hypothetical protein DU508_13620 [Pedobacter chinensis]